MHPIAPLLAILCVAATPARAVEAEEESERGLRLGGRLVGPELVRADVQHLD